MSVHGVSARAFARRLTVLALVGLACSALSRHQGTATDLEPRDDGGWLVTIELTRPIEGADVVIVGFARGELQCESGAAVELDAAPGLEISFDRHDSGMLTSNPPIIGGRDGRLDC